MMDKIKLSEHVKKGDTFYTCFTNPDGLGSTLRLSSWSQNSLPEYIWLAIVIDELGRKPGLEKLYMIAKELKENGLAIPSLSGIRALSDLRQAEYWDIVSRHIQLKMLSPLTVVLTPDWNGVFFEKCFDPSMSIDYAMGRLISLLKKCLTFHDELSTDVCFIVDWFYILDGKLHFNTELKETTKAFSEYYKCEHSDEMMKMYRPAIRSIMQVITQIPEKTDFADDFWKALGELSECTLMKIEWKDNGTDEFFCLTKKVVEFIAATNEDRKFEVKYNVMAAMLCYVFKIYEEIEEKGMYDCISGRIAFRTMTEAYILLKYMIMKEKDVPDIFDQFKAYGTGKYKLIMAKLRENKYSIDEKSQLDMHYMELMVNEEYNEAFVNMSVGYFEGNIKNKFKECGENELYEIYYEYGSNYSHGLWGAIRESSMLFCDNPAHAYHSFPDYQAEQKQKSIRNDCEMLMKKFLSLLSGQIELPGFYADSINSIGETTDGKTTTGKNDE